MLLWQMELGADEAIGEVPVNRYAAVEAAKAVAPASVPVAAPAAVVAARSGPPGEDPVLVARRMAEGARDLAALRDALAAYDHCDLKKGARSLVFADGNPAARVMIVGEAPGQEEDRQGLPFVGRAGQLLDRMFERSGWGGRTRMPSVRSTSRTSCRGGRPGTGTRVPEEAAMMLPFLKRHVELADPEVLVLMGNHSCQALLGRKGITRLRGQWTEALGRPVLPMFHPSYLLRTPSAKREAWHDLLMLQARLRGAHDRPVSFLAFVPVALALNLTPGADMMFCFAQGMKGGPRPADRGVGGDFRGVDDPRAAGGAGPWRARGGVSVGVRRDPLDRRGYLAGLRGRRSARRLS